MVTSLNYIIFYIYVTVFKAYVKTTKWNFLLKHWTKIFKININSLTNLEYCDDINTLELISLKATNFILKSSLL